MIEKLKSTENNPLNNFYFNLLATSALMCTS